MRKTLIENLPFSKSIVVSEGNKGVSPGTPNIGGGKEMKNNVVLSDAEVKKGGGNKMLKNFVLSSVAMLIKGGKEMKNNAMVSVEVSKVSKVNCDVSEANNKEEKEMERLIGVDVSVGKDVVEVMEFPDEGGFRILLTLPAYIVGEVDCNDNHFIIAVDYGYFIVSKSSGEIHFSPEPFSLYEEEGAEGMIDPRSQYSPSELFEMGMIDTLKGGKEMKGRLDYYCYDNGEETLFVVALLNAPTAEDLFEIPMADVISYQVSESFVTIITLDTVYTVSKLGEVNTSSC